MSIRIDYKERIEAITALKVYPINVPDKTKYPCIQMLLSGGKRDTDSGLSGGSSIRGYRLSLTILASKASECYTIEELLIAGLDELPLVTDDTTTLIMYFDNSVELYNHQQRLYEVTVDFKTKQLK